MILNFSLAVSAQGRCDRSLGMYFLVVDAFCNSGLGRPHQPMQSGYAGTELHGFPSTELRDCLGLNTRHSQEPNSREVAELERHPPAITLEAQNNLRIYSMRIA